MAFYQCQKCKNTWQYNIDKCPECFLELKRIKSKKVKVIGISKVNIPSVLHPKTPYFILVLEDEKNNRWAHKSTQEYKIGDEFVLKSNEGKETVGIWQSNYDILGAIEKTVELIGGLKKINNNSKVLILPTLLSPKHPYLAENTSPEFLENTIKFLIQNGVNVKNIKVASQSFDDIPIEASAQKSQLFNVCSEYKVTPLDLSQTNFVKKEIDNLSFELSEQVFENDLVINLPILKLDEKTQIKGASNNVLKFLKKESYLSLKYLNNYQNLVKKLQKILPEHLSLAEGISIQKSDKYVIYLGLIFASHNSLNLDRVFAEVTMVDLPEYLKDIRIEHIPVVGRKIAEMQHDVGKLL